MSMSPAELRALFPALKTWTWLNAAASSPLPLPVSDAFTAYTLECSTRGDIGFPRWLALRDSLRTRFAKFLNAKSSEIAFTPSTSFGFHLAGTMLKARGVKEVLTLECEFPSTTLPLLHDGLELQVVKARPDGSFPLSDIEAAITSKTGAIAVSVVQFASGFRVDLEGLAALCRARKLHLVLNAAQALGHAPIDVAALGVSFLAGTSHKWFMGGYGIGTLFIREDWCHDIEIPMGGWQSVPGEHLWKSFHGSEVHDAGRTFHAAGTQFRKDAAAVEAGGMNWAGLMGFDAALGLHEQLGVANTLEHNIQLQLHLRSQLRARGFTPNAPDDVKTLSGICVVPVAGDVMETVRTLLREANIVTTPRGGGLRISTHAFNIREDVDRLIAEIDRLKIRPAP